MGELTKSQRALLLESEPLDGVGRDALGVEIRGPLYAVARSLERKGLGTHSHGSPYGDLYFNNESGLELRAELLGGGRCCDCERLFEQLEDGSRCYECARLEQPQ